MDNYMLIRFNGYQKGGRVEPCFRPDDLVITYVAETHRMWTDPAQPFYPQINKTHTVYAILRVSWDGKLVSGPLRHSRGLITPKCWPLLISHYERVKK